MTENTSDRSPDDTMDPDKEARMLLNPPNESVQFSQNTTSTNGQVVLPVNNRASTGVGMTKQELMKYANDPFWIRLRMFLFILFWVVWVAMLVGAVLIIMFAPGCPATASLPWWKKCSLVQVSVKSEGSTLKEKVSSANADLKSLKDNLSTLKSAKLDGIILTGLDPFLLDNTNNVTAAEVEKFRNALTELVSEIHGDDVKGKILIGLTLTETSTEHPWFKESQKNGTTVGYYLWKDSSPPNVSLSWDYNTERYKYYGRKSANKAVLNYGDSGMQEKMRDLVLNWVRTKLDGIQADGDFWVEDQEGRVHVSSEVNLQVHKWVKTGGENKALLLADSQLAPELVKQGEDAASFELSPESSLWKELDKATDLKEALKKAFSHYVQLDASAPDQNTTTKDGTAAPVNVGQGWRSFNVLYPASEKNQIAQKQGLSIAEGVLAAFYLLPKSTPILQTDAPVAEQLNQLKDNKLLLKLGELRRVQSESLLLGSTQLPTVSSDQVFAVSRVYKDKNAYLLLINFGQTSQETEVKGTFPSATTHTIKIVLTDSKSDAKLVGQDVNLSKVKLEPKQVLLVEFALKE